MHHLRRLNLSKITSRPRVRRRSSFQSLRPIFQSLFRYQLGFGDFSEWIFLSETKRHLLSFKSQELLDRNAFEMTESHRTES